MNTVIDIKSLKKKRHMPPVDVQFIALQEEPMPIPMPMPMPMPTPKNVMDMIELAERDKYICQIENQIKAKREMLLNKQRYLAKSVKENKFLETVRNDYDKYNRFIIQEREEQMRAMDMLTKYLDDIIVSGKLTDEDIKQSKKEQHKIIREMKSIKNNLDKMVEDHEN
jgi:hypothetical protein